MKVIDHQPRAWFLLEDGKQLYLDVHCSHSFFDYSVLIALTGEEAARFAQAGRDYLDRLAHEVHYSAPAARGSNSPYRGRNLSSPPTPEDEAAQAAIAAWVKTGRA